MYSITTNETVIDMDLRLNAFYMIYAKRCGGKSWLIHGILTNLEKNHGIDEYLIIAPADKVEPFYRERYFENNVRILHEYNKNVVDAFVKLYDDDNVKKVIVFDDCFNEYDNPNIIEYMLNLTNRGITCVVAQQIFKKHDLVRTIDYVLFGKCEFVGDIKKVKSYLSSCVGNRRLAENAIQEQGEQEWSFIMTEKQNDVVENPV